MTRRIDRPEPRTIEPDRTFRIASGCLQPSCRDAVMNDHRPITNTHHSPREAIDSWPAKRRSSIQSNGHTLLPADGGVPGPPLDALQGVRPQQHHELPDRGVQGGRGEPLHDRQVQRHRLLEQDARPTSSSTATASTRCTAGCRRWRPGAAVANASCSAIGISGDGDTANIGMGQFKHACRRNLPLVYIIENNGCYGLTKGQFSATADLHAHLRRETGEENTIPPFDLCLEAIAAGATFVARSFAGDKKQLVPLLKAALQAPRDCRARHHQPVRHLQRLRLLDQELGLGPRARGAAPRGRLRPPAPRDRGRAEGRRVHPRPAPRRLLDRPPRPAARRAQGDRPRLGRSGSWSRARSATSSSPA